MRANVGIDPVYLLDSHLVAESVELTMVPGILRRNNMQMASPVPAQFKLGKGHMLFFTNKLEYLRRRLEAVNAEMIRREFSPGTVIKPELFPAHLRGDWMPTKADRNILIARIVEKIVAKSDFFWRYQRIPVTNKRAVELIRSSAEHEILV